ncbi:hypothetical protein Tco_0557896, partial [Tanacetum coccineum]
MIDMAELVRLQIYAQFDDTAWVAMGPERQPDAVAGAPGVAQDPRLLMRVTRLFWHPYRHLSSHLRHHQLLPGPCLKGWPDLRRT